MDDDVYVPSPWRSLKWVGIWGMGVVIALVVIWWGWDWWAGKCLREKIAMYREKGEVVTMEELAGNALGDGENKLVMVKKASGALVATRAEREVLYSDQDSNAMKLPLSEREMGLIKEVMAKNEAVTAWLEKARKCEGVYFLEGAGGMEMGTFRPMDNYLRSIGLYFHQMQRDDLLDDLFQEMEQVGRVQAEGHYLFTQAISMSEYTLDARMLIEVSPDLEIASEAHPQGVARDVVEKWIGQLLDSREMEESLQRNLEGERIIRTGYGEKMEAHSFLMRALFRFGELRAMRNVDSVKRAFGEGLRPGNEVMADFPASHEREGNLSEAVYFVYSEISRSTLMQYRGIMERRAAALRLAIRLYEVDHGGKLPGDLKELVPQYLSGVPVDLFRADGKGLTYVRERRLFYSVGLNGIDDGGKGNPGDRGTNWSYALDAVYPLDRVEKK